MTVRRRTTRARTPAQIAARIPRALRRLPPTLPVDGYKPHEANAELVYNYQLYMHELEAAVYEVTRNGGMIETVEVARSLGTAPADWFGAVFA